MSMGEDNYQYFTHRWARLVAALDQPRRSNVASLHKEAAA